MKVKYDVSKKLEQIHARKFLELLRKPRFVKLFVLPKFAGRFFNLVHTSV